MATKKQDPAVYDPSDDTVDGVNAFLDKNPDQVSRVMGAEFYGKRRHGVLQGPHEVDPATYVQVPNIVDGATTGLTYTVLTPRQAETLYAHTGSTVTAGVSEDNPVVKKVNGGTM